MRSHASQVLIRAQKRLARPAPARPDRFLHRAQARALPRLGALIQEHRGARAFLATETEAMTKVVAAPWHHEAEGVVRVGATASVTAREVQASRRLSAALGEVERLARRAPRVLNAGFRPADSPTMLRPRQALRSGRPYDLLVDVGPAWDRARSLVTGSAEWPEEAVPQDEPDGHTIQVVIVSEAFSPQMLQADMWVPRYRGRSFPMADGRLAATSGPVALRFRAPGVADTRC